MRQTNAGTNKNEHAEDDKRISEFKEKRAYTDPSNDTDLNTNKQANGRESRVLSTETSKNSSSTTGCVEATIGDTCYQVKAINEMQIHIQADINSFAPKKGDFLRIGIHSKLPQAQGKSTDVRLELLACVVNANSRESQTIVCQIESPTPLDIILLRELAAFVDHPAPEEQSVPQPKDRQSASNQVNEITKKTKTHKRNNPMWRQHHIFNHH